MNKAEPVPGPIGCVRCGRVGPRIASVRSGLCTGCHRPAPRPCGRCGKTAEIAVKAAKDNPDICVNCYELPTATCVGCGRVRPCYHVAGGEPTCARCLARRTAICAHCGEDRPPTARWAEGAVCDPCYGKALRRRGRCAGCGAERRLVSPPGPAARLCCDCAGIAPMHRCSKCGIEDKLYERGLCDRCALKRRASVLMAGPDGTIPAALVGVYDAVVASATPRKALNWLRQGAGAPILAAMASGAMEVSHEALDAHPRRRAADHVRQMLVANGALAARDEQLVRLERRISEAIAAVGRPADRKVLTAFATWRVLRNVRREAERSATGRTAISHARNQIVGAASFLDWLAEEDLELATCTQGDLERWLVGPPWRYDVRHFLTWTTERKVSSKLTVPPLRSGPGDSLDAEERWAIIQQLLRDPTIATADRVAGCFVLCYAQRLSHIATMTVDRVNCHSDVVSVRFGRRDVVVPQPLAGHVRTLVAAGRSSHVGIGSPPKSSWLFPGHLPGRPITASRLGQRLAACGIKDARAARRSALQQLAAEMPAVVIAELLGISVRCAVGWVQAAGGDWARYAGTTARDRITER